MDYTSASGNIATVTEYTRENKVFVSICWDCKPSQEDADEFNAWYMRTHPDSRLAGSEISGLSEQPAIRHKFFEGEAK